MRTKSNLKQGLVFHPNDEEFADPEAYIESIREQVAEYGGIAKIVPPPSFRPPSIEGAYQMKFRILTQYTDRVCNGIFRGTFKSNEDCSVDQLQQWISEPKYLKSTRVMDMSTPALERQFWKQISTDVGPLYGTDIPGTLFTKDDSLWNLNEFPSPLFRYRPDMPGITTSFLYFGTWRSYFSWHKEDLDLASINYLHFGEPKQWYGLAPADGGLLEDLVSHILPSDFKKCPDFLRHKTVLADPELVTAETGATVVSLVQQPGEYIITVPGAYHSGFNTGFNCAEAVNFVTQDWLELDIEDCVKCDCRPRPHIDQGEIRLQMGLPPRAGPGDHGSHQEESSAEVQAVSASSPEVMISLPIVSIPV
eukprot:TRINITY_DN1228_c0_g3_i1.p1 TRINITY_DN1228_c0_g3~~TRINITY_DN1228_c0_g3_i1.p1  ORF type:complete len:364 (-),score=77.94 TRINITY_DN1228_c0_g3_i1:403-1494(-)